MIKEFQGEYRWLSNFWPSLMVIDRESYATVEHYYQSMKTNDKFKRELIRQAPNPYKAKRLGKNVTVRGGWYRVKSNIMYTGLKEKFVQNDDLKKKLLDTGDQLLQEGNRWGDKYWGVDLETGEGENKLGQLLMIVREELR